MPEIAQDRTCPHCGRLNDRTQDLGGGRGPQPGDVSICFGCKKLSVFTATELRIPSPDEAARIESGEEVRRVRALMMFGLGPRTTARIAREGRP